MSPHKEYIDLLPKVNDHHIMLWTTDELKLLEGSDLEEVVKVFKPSVEFRFEILLHVIKDFGVWQKHSLFEWSEAHALFMSRHFGERTDYTDTRFMAPLADLFNHKNLADPNPMDQINCFG